MFLYDVDYIDIEAEKKSINSAEVHVYHVFLKIIITWYKFYFRFLLTFILFHLYLDHVDQITLTLIWIYRILHILPLFLTDILVIMRYISVL